MFIFQVEFQFLERLPVGGLVLLELVFQSEFQFLKEALLESKFPAAPRHRP